MEKGCCILAWTDRTSETMHQNTRDNILFFVLIPILKGMLSEERTSQIRTAGLKNIMLFG